MLFGKEPSPIEVLNDIDERIINWWRVVRDHPEEFGHLVEHTPSSRSELEVQHGRLEDPDPIRRALATHVVLAYGDQNGLGAKPSFATRHGAGTMHDRESIARLAKRMREVRLESDDACRIAEKFVSAENSVMYLDPPYEDADTTAYGVDKLDRDRMTRVLKEASGFVALSGFNDEWDHLDWQRHERPVTSTAALRAKGDRPGRIEVLWTNETVAQADLFS